MTAGSSLLFFKRFLPIGISALLALTLLPGCGPEGYSEDMVYSVRTDPLVVGLPQSNPNQFDPPGKLSEMPKRLKELDKNLVVDPAELDSQDRKQIQTTLSEIFGTPAHPKVEGEIEINDEIEDIAVALHLVDDQSGQGTLLERGSKLYREHCLHCHGLTGDGHGPTAPWVNPHPRDYRLGKFKFSSSSQGAGLRKPRRADLIRTLRQGIEGTSMPSFGLLPEEELEALISYVIHLSIRGQVEYETMRAKLKNEALQDADSNELELKEFMAYRVRGIAKSWQEADSKAIKPGAYPKYSSNELVQSIRKGYQTFSKQGDAGCIKCHGDFGRKNEFRYDDWGTIVRPTNLTKSEYRGGRRPIDLYWRIHSGINGSQMPAFADLLKEQGLWDMVNFLEALPYPNMLPDDVRDQIYSSPPSKAKE